MRDSIVFDLPTLWYAKHSGSFAMRRVPSERQPFRKTATDWATRHPAILQATRLDCYREHSDLAPLGCGSLAFCQKIDLFVRRFSQRNHLVTLNEINITPLLDLAFVLLIIFIITTPLLEQSLDLRLPKGGTANQKINRDDIATAEVDAKGNFVLNTRKLADFPQLESELSRLKKARPNLVVTVRASKDGRYEYPFQIMNLCQRLGVGISLASEQPPSRTQ